VLPRAHSTSRFFRPGRGLRKAHGQCPKHGDLRRPGLSPFDVISPINIETILPSKPIGVAREILKPQVNVQRRELW
jgi:hypothetical protein